MAPVNFSGTWELSKSENFKEYLQALGVPQEKIDIAASLTPVETIVQHGDDFKITLTTPKGDKTKSFKVGQEIEDEIEQTGAKVKVAFSWQGNSLKTTVTPQDPGKPNGSNTRTLDGANMIVTLVAGNVTCTRTFTKK